MNVITTKNITNANDTQILKGEKVQCLYISKLGNNIYYLLIININKSNGGVNYAWYNN